MLHVFVLGKHISQHSEICSSKVVLRSDKYLKLCPQNGQESVEK